MISGVDDVAVRVQALDLGAVDFVVKPFHNVELVARVRARLRLTRRFRSAEGAHRAPPPARR